MDRIADSLTSSPLALSAPAPVQGTGQPPEAAPPESPARDTGGFAAVLGRVQGPAAVSREAGEGSGVGSAPEVATRWDAPNEAREAGAQVRSGPAANAPLVGGPAPESVPASGIGPVGEMGLQRQGIAAAVALQWAALVQTPGSKQGESGGPAAPGAWISGAEAGSVVVPEGQDEVPMPAALPGGEGAWAQHTALMAAMTGMAEGRSSTVPDGVAAGNGAMAGGTADQSAPSPSALVPPLVALQISPQLSVITAAAQPAASDADLMAFASAQGFDAVAMARMFGPGTAGAVSGAMAQAAGTDAGPTPGAADSGAGEWAALTAKQLAAASATAGVVGASAGQGGPAAQVDSSSPGPLVVASAIAGMAVTSASASRAGSDLVGAGTAVSAGPVAAFMPVSKPASTLVTGPIPVSIATPNATPAQAAASVQASSIAGMVEASSQAGGPMVGSGSAAPTSLAAALKAGSAEGPSSGALGASAGAGGGLGIGPTGQGPAQGQTSWAASAGRQDPLALMSGGAAAGSALPASAWLSLQSSSMGLNAPTEATGMGGVPASVDGLMPVGGLTPAGAAAVSASAGTGLESSLAAASASSGPAVSSSSADAAASRVVDSQPIDLRDHLEQSREALSRRLGEALAARVLSQLEKGEWQVRLSVTPQHLGPIDIDLQMRGSRLEAQFQVANGQTQALIQDSLPRLRDAVGSAGMDLASAWVSAGLGDRNRGNPTPGQPDDPAPTALNEVAGVEQAVTGVETVESRGPGWTPRPGAVDILI